MSKNLCKTCRNAMLVEGHAVGQTQVKCLCLDEVIPWPVRRCSQYNDKRLPMLAAMEQIAWVLVSKKAGREIGFVRGVPVQREEGE